MELNEQQVIKDYYNLRSCRAVSEKYGCNPETIRRILKRNDIKLTGWKCPPKKEPNRRCPAHITYTDEEVINAYLRLGTQDKVRDELCISHTTVYRILKRNNIPSTGRQGNHGGGTPPKITDEQLIEACKAMTRQEIADAYGMHIASVDRRTRKLGIHAVSITREASRHPRYQRTWDEYVSKVKEEAEKRKAQKEKEKAIK